MKAFSVLLLAAIFPFLQACDAVDNRLDCNEICQRYDDCVGGYDVSACKNRCVDSATNDKDFASKVDHCSDCIDDRSCTGAAFACGSECVGIVP